MRLKSKTVLSRNLGGNRTMFRTSILVSFLSALVSADLNNHSSNSALLHARRVAASANDAESNTSYSEDRAIEEDARRSVGHSLSES